MREIATNKAKLITTQVVIKKCVNGRRSGDRRCRTNPIRGEVVVMALKCGPRGAFHVDGPIPGNSDSPSR